MQWTPKDKQAFIKLNCKCDKLFEILMNKLEIEVDNYDKDKDRLRELYSELKANEQSTCNRYQLFSKNSSFKTDTESSNLLLIKPSWFGKGIKGKK